MQNRYTGDVGDFGKLALLRSLSPGKRLGVCWYLCSGAGETNGDGKHLGYLEKPKRFRPLDEVAFDTLQRLVVGFKSGHLRSVESLEQSGLLGGAVFHGSEVPRARAGREEWFAAMKLAIKSCDLVFLDPDNGIEGGQVTPKHVRLEEIRQLLEPQRSLLVYHHQTRLKGGAPEERKRLSKRFRSSGARHVALLRLRPYSPRFYALLNGDTEMVERLRVFAGMWGEKLAELHIEA